MADEEKAPEEDLGDTDERFQDHPELAPDESRISVEKVKDIKKESIRRRAELGDFSEGSREADLGFKRNWDIAGDEASQSTDADFSRGSGRLGEDPGAETTHRETKRKDPATVREEQERAAVGGYAAGETGISETASGPSAASPTSDLEADIEEQGRDLGKGPQVTGIQRFGRDVGSQGLSQIDAEGEGGRREGSMGRQYQGEHRDWSAVLRKLGGSSPGSQENLALADRFHSVQFPAHREDVLKRLEPAAAEFRFAPDIAVDLRHAVSSSRNEVFRTMNDLIDCVKDELRRAEKPVF
jgi:hypothetical protein